MSRITDRLRRTWNAFTNKDPTPEWAGGVSYYRPDRPRFTRGNERSVVTAVLNRIAIDAAQIDIKHIKTDNDGRYLEDADSDLNNCLTLDANIDQTGRALRQDIVMSMLDEGAIAIVPVDTDDDPNFTDGYSIQTLRVGKIISWYPNKVRVKLYNELTGRHEEIEVSKRFTSIVENPLFAVMNEPNSTVQRLTRKLNLLDAIDEQSGSGKLDLIIQLPYVVKTDLQKRKAEERRKDIEHQLAGSKYGIAYIDGTEHVTQLNRAVENNLMHQIEYLTALMFSQLGITQGVLDGSADEQTMLNYYNRTIEPILAAITDEMTRKFISKTARSQNYSVAFFRDPFKLVPVSQIAEISDKMTRNEIMTSNEVRQVIGMKPSNDPKADELRNKNINQPESELMDKQGSNATELMSNTKLPNNIKEAIQNEA